MKTDFCIPDTIVKNATVGDSTVCEWLATPFGPRLLEFPILATSHICEFCGGNAFYTPIFDPSISQARYLLCANPICAVYSAPFKGEATRPTGLPRRELEWPVFCDLCGIGDLMYDLRFEQVQQDPKKIECFHAFAAKPCSLLLIRGKPGTGKTFAALGVCELFTRKNSSCFFITQRNLLSRWLDKHDIDFIKKLKTISLLVIDDFGSAQPSPGFLDYVQELINSRIQWSNRGTIITTNLDDTMLSTYCAEALCRRISSGKLLNFDGKPRKMRTL